MGAQSSAVRFGPVHLRHNDICSTCHFLIEQPYTIEQPLSQASTVRRGQEGIGSCNSDCNKCYAQSRGRQIGGCTGRLWCSRSERGCSQTAFHQHSSCAGGWCCPGTGLTSWARPNAVACSWLAGLTWDRCTHSQWCFCSSMVQPFSPPCQSGYSWTLGPQLSCIWGTALNDMQSRHKERHPWPGTWGSQSLDCNDKGKR